MRRIDTPTKAPDLFGSGKDGFRDGQPPGVASTRLNAAMFNALQEEIARLIEAIGIDIQPGVYDQMRKAHVLADMFRAHSVDNEAPGLTTETLWAITDRPSSPSSYIIAVGENGTILYRSGNDGWEAASVGGGFSDNFYDVTHGAYNGFVAVGDGGEFQQSGTGDEFFRVYNGGDALRSVAASDNPSGIDRVVAVGDAGMLVVSVSGASPQRLSSPPFATGPSTGPNIKSVAYGEGLFVASVDGGGSRIAYSLDGTSWNPCLDTSGPVIDKLIYSEELGIFLGSWGRYSADGITWSSGGHWGNARSLLATTAGILSIQGIDGYATFPFGVVPPLGPNEPRKAPYGGVVLDARLSHNYDGIWVCGLHGRVGFAPLPFGR